MTLGFCRFCKRDINSNAGYFSYCNISCCADFANEQRISFAEARDLDSGAQERMDLEDRISELECSYDSASGEASRLYDDLDTAKYKIIGLKEKLKELESLDWEKIKKERAREKEYNESVFRKMNNIKEDNDHINEKMGNVQKDNILLKDQNLELLNSIKEMKGLSERFQQLDLGIKLEYDE